jgi:fatty-acyl-CoA synthase
MLHQPTSRTDLPMWAYGTLAVTALIEARIVIVSDPFMAVVPVLDQPGIAVLTIAELLDSTPLMRLTAIRTNWRCCN